jgi:hypothetical protein
MEKLIVSNNPENEIKKFRWLRTQGVISEEELEGKIRQVTLAHSKQIGES